MLQSLCTPFLLQSLRTPMLFDGWLIDWVRGNASKSAHSHVIRWLIDWLSTRICFKVCAPRFCFKVCALPCYSMVDWLIEYKEMPQSLRTPMLFDGWLIDWVQGNASKSAHSHVIRWLIDWLSTRICLKVWAPRFCFKVCALPCYSMVDWLIEYEDMPQSLGIPFLLQSLRTLKNRHFPETNRPNSANSSLPMGLVIVLRLKQKWRQSLRWLSRKMEKNYRQCLPNQSINHRNTWECADFEAYPRAVHTKFDTKKFHSNFIIFFVFNDVQTLCYSSSIYFL